ncbi:hypothetical protein J0383_21275 [Flavobacterium endoglycinae]|uniref:Uncharacterized protein n=1 Tax=Flavobacterium endoglycinae TaxID=2816357 RepID=A0ABX7QDU0_9FLAO|nr:hypothetical protein [Flavobacterium endoglycinae]QSW88758.1 hypothetical protein J0383_21275 [Flavobacterium endoglycinae]
MGLFNFFNAKQNTNSNTDIRQDNLANTLVEIPENVFLEKEKPTTENVQNDRSVSSSENGISLLFNFIEKNYEGKGYDDALINPDNIHLEQNVEALKNDLERTIRKIKTFYEDFIREINFHIETRSRSGMVDTVEELTVKKDTAEEHISQILVIENEAKENKGIGYGIILSYKRGFNNGLAAISHHSIMKKNF